MKVKDIKKLLSAEVLTGDTCMDVEIKCGCGCDLMSDVLAFVKEDVVLLTGLIHPQVIRTAEMLDIRVVVIVRGKEPSEEFISMATDREIVVLSTEISLFNASGILYSEGLRGEEITDFEESLPG